MGKRIIFCLDCTVGHLLFVVTSSRLNCLSEFMKSYMKSNFGMAWVLQLSKYIGENSFQNDLFSKQIPFF